MVLSAKQRKAIAAAPPNRKQQMRQAFITQNDTARRMPPNSSITFGRNNALAVLPRRRAPATRNRSLPNMGRIPRPLGGPNRSLAWAFDGFDHRHLPFDEKTAPYVVSNYLSYLNVETSDSHGKVIIIAPRLRPSTGIGAIATGNAGNVANVTLANDNQVLVEGTSNLTFDTQDWHPHGKGGPMSDIIAYVYNNGEGISPGMDHLDYVQCDVLGGSIPASTEHFYPDRVRIHNMSANIECLGASAGLYPKGIAYCGAVPALETPTNASGMTTIAVSSIVHDQWVQPAIATGYIRGYSAASLLTKPVRVDSAVSENIEYKTWRNGYMPRNDTKHGGYPIYTGMEPIVVYIPSVYGVTVQYRIAIGTQWTTRHPVDVRLRSKQQNYTPTPTNHWHAACGSVKDAAQTALEHASASLGAGASHLLAGAATHVANELATHAPAMMEGIVGV